MKHALLYLVIGIAIVSGCTDKAHTIRPQKRDWVESVYASSKISSLHQYEHRPEITGRLLKYTVQEGDTVNAGDLIAIIDGVGAEIRVSLAKEQKKQAESAQGRIRELKALINQNRVSYEQDSLDYHRQVRLFNSGIGSQSQLEVRKLKMQQSRTQLQSLLQRFQALSGEITAQLKQANHNLSLAQEQRNAYYIYAFNRGCVYELMSEPGELVSPQQPIALIGDPSSFLVELEIDERDITKIKSNQMVIVKLDAYEKTYKAIITRISKRLDPKTQTFHAEARFTETHPRFYPGLTAESNIIIQEKKGVMVIPVASLKAANLIETSQGDVQITTGLRNSQWVEVTSGIDLNTEIVMQHEP